MAQRAKRNQPRVRAPAPRRPPASSSGGGARHARRCTTSSSSGSGWSALGVFFACVLWLGLNGGPVTSAVRSGIGWAAYVLPLVLCPLGTLVATRSELVCRGPFRLGGALGLLGLMPALGRAHGGFVGRELEALVGRGVGSTGTTILGVLVALIGVLLLTGASLGGADPPLGRRRPDRLDAGAARDGAGAPGDPPSASRTSRSPSATATRTPRLSGPRPPSTASNRSPTSSPSRRRPPNGRRSQPPAAPDQHRFPPAAEDEETNPRSSTSGPPPRDYRLPDRALLRSPTRSRARAARRTAASPRRCCAASRASGSRRPRSARSPARA